MFPLKHTPNFAKFALSASCEALSSSGLLDLPREYRNRFGVVVGSGFGETESFSTFDKNKTSPYFIPGTLMSSACAQIGLCFGLKGPSFAISSACATGSQSIGAGFSHILLGRADAVVCGGSECTFGCKAVHNGFSACRALSRDFTNSPEKASRPFDKIRAGFVLSEGAAVLVLEDRKFAMRRGAKILAEVLACGESTDAHHITCPSPGGEGALRALKMAFSSCRAKIPKTSVDFISAHASSTKIGDLTEAQTLRKFFGGKSQSPPVYSIKGAIGHSLGAAGAIELAIGIKSLNEGIILPTLNAEEIDDEIDINVNKKLIRKKTKCFLANSFGFGGHNSCLLLGSKEFGDEIFEKQ